MPNGGVPLHMVIKLRSGDHVVYCQAGTVCVYTAAEWNRPPQEDRKPLLALQEDEAKTLAAFLNYWSGADQVPAIPRLRGVDVEYDY